eukprot:scaffold167588_cov17-Tisochrysis_lutea.AAC.2
MEATPISHVPWVSAITVTLPSCRPCSSEMRQPTCPSSGGSGSWSVRGGAQQQEHAAGDENVIPCRPSSGCGA